MIEDNMPKQKATSSLPSFSIIIPTYSGIDTIQQTLKSISSQKAPAAYELIIVIDGPVQELSRIAQAAKKEFTQTGVKTTIVQFNVNHGRFEARIAGAHASSSEQLLFIDDRVRLDNEFFSYITQSDKQVVMPNVIELATSNMISLTINMLRKRLYGKRAIGKFGSYHIDKNNFERSPKGTTCLYIDKATFLAACHKVELGLKQLDSRRISDDTKVLHQVVIDGTPIFRTDKLNVYYLPRNSLKEAGQHLFRRGPLFVDYYSKPGTRFFPLLIAIYLTITIVLATAFVEPTWLVYYLIIFLTLIILISAVIAKSIREYMIALIGLPITLLIFSIGIITGTFLKIAGK